jgi:hypothetical protein
LHTFGSVGTRWVLINKETQMQKLNPNAETVRTSISYDQDMAEELQELVDFEGVSKNFFIRRAIRVEIKKAQKTMERKKK